MMENSRAPENTDVGIEASWAGLRQERHEVTQYDFQHAHTGLGGGRGQFMPVSIFDKGPGAEGGHARTVVPTTRGLTLRWR
jgi:hypothetical protein